MDANILCIWPPNRGTSLLGSLDKAINDGCKHFEFKSGLQEKDFVSLDSATDQICRLYASDNNGIFNVCSGIPTSVKTFAQNYLNEKNIDMVLHLGKISIPEHEKNSFWGKLDLGTTTTPPFLMPTRRKMRIRILHQSDCVIIMN